MVSAAIKNRADPATRLLLLDAVTRGDRPYMERRLSRDLVSLYRRFAREFAIGVALSLELLSREVAAFGRRRLTMGVRAYRLGVRDIVDSYVSPVLASMPLAMYQQKTVDIIEAYSLWFYTYGGVTALEAMGFEARGVYPRIVSKAVADPNEILFELTDPEVKHFMHNRAVAHGAGITKTTIRGARKTVEDAVFRGTQDVSQAAVGIARRAGIPEWRGLKIARTEAGQSFNTAMNDTYLRSGVKFHSWITVGDRRVRPLHTKNELAGSIPLGAPFPSGQRHPGEGADSINCRCTIFPDMATSGLLIRPWDGRAGMRVRQRPPTLRMPKKAPVAPVVRSTVTEVNPPAFGPPNKPRVTGALPKTVEALDVYAKELQIAIEEWATDVGYIVRAKRRLYSVTAKRKQLVGKLVQEKPEISRLVSAKYPVAVDDGVDSLARYTRADGSLTPERQALHDRVVARHLAGTRRATNPQADMMGGGPASGKSVLLKKGKVNLPDDLVVIDSDEIKKMLPDYSDLVTSGDPRAAAFAHEESSMLAKRIMAEAVRRGRNVMLDGTGDSSLASLHKKVSAFRAGGHRVVANYVTVDTEVAVARNIARAKKSGRMVPTDFVRGVHESISEILPEAIKRGYFDELVLWDTNTDGVVIKVLSHIDGKTVIHNEELWLRFLSKAKPRPLPV